MIKIKNNYVNGAKIIGVQYAESQKNNKNYLIVEIDAVSADQKKVFIEVDGMTEFNALIGDIRTQMQ